MNKLPAYKLPVMKEHCPSCPFKLMKDGRMQNPQLVTEVQGRTLFKAHQICHGTEVGEDRQPKNRCKGSFDANMVIYERMGYGHLVK